MNSTVVLTPGTKKAHVYEYARVVVLAILRHTICKYILVVYRDESGNSFYLSSSLNKNNLKAFSRSEVGLPGCDDSN